MKQLVVAFLAITGLLSATTLVTVPEVGAINVFGSCETEKSKPKDEQSAVCAEANTDSINSPIQNIIGLMLFAIGTISVIMIIVGGIRYVISNGEAARIKSAKDTILYAVIGLIVSLLAYAIVNFVLNQFG